EMNAARGQSGHLDDIEALGLDDDVLPAGLLRGHAARGVLRCHAGVALQCASVGLGVLRGHATAALGVLPRDGHAVILCAHHDVTLGDLPCGDVPGTTLVAHA